MFHSPDDIRAALKRLGLKLALRDSEEYTLLICGGSALNLTSSFTRGTRDVDALGIVSGINKRSNPTIMPELPEELINAAHEVAQELRLDTDWLNTAAQPLLAMGLPPGIKTRGRRSFPAEGL